MTDLPAPPQPLSLPRVIVTAIGLSVIVGLLLLALSWPLVTSKPKNIPIAIVGPAPVAAQMSAGLGKAAPGLFDVSPVAGRDEAVARIRQRHAYGAIVLGPQPEVLTASAGSPIVAQMLGAFAPRLQAQMQAAAAAAGRPPVVVKTTDVAPLASTDRTGAGMIAAAFPLLMGGMLGGMALGLLAQGATARLAGLTVYALAGGFVITSVLQSWFGLLQGSFLMNALFFALALSSIAATLAGLIATLGIRGAALGPVIFMMFANPIASAGAPTQFLPEPWGEIGQWFPPGAAASLLRSLSYFPDADTTFPWFVLGGWTLLGAALVFVGHARAQRSSQGARMIVEDALSVD